MMIPEDKLLAMLAAMDQCNADLEKVINDDIPRAKEALLFLMSADTNAIMERVKIDVGFVQVISTIAMTGLAERFLARARDKHREAEQG